MRIACVIKLLVFYVALVSFGFHLAIAQNAVPGADTHQVGSAPAAASSPALQQRDSLYTFRVNDAFDIEFPYSPEFNQSVRVGPDGYVPLRGAPAPVHVGGLNVPEATQAIGKAYAGILRSPAINIMLKEFEKPYFIASGEVDKPGKYELLGDTTVTQALAIAGGLRDTAKRSQVLVLRRVSKDMVKVTTLDVKHMMSDAGINEDMQLHPGDTIYVPKSTFSKIKSFLPNYGTGVQYNPK